MQHSFTVTQTRSWLPINLCLYSFSFPLSVSVSITFPISIMAFFFISISGNFRFMTKLSGRIHEKHLKFVRMRTQSPANLIHQSITIIQRQSYKTRFNSGVMRFTNPHSHTQIILSFIRIQIKRPRTLSPPPLLKLKKVLNLSIRPEPNLVRIRQSLTM